MDFTSHNNFVMPHDWFEQLQKAMGKSLEPALAFLGTMMKEGCKYPYLYIRPPRRIEAGVLAWMLLRKMTVEKLYDDPRFFNELRVTLTVHALGEYKDNAETNQQLISLAQVAENIIQGVIEKELPWETVESALVEVVQAAPVPTPASDLPWWYPLHDREIYKIAQAA